MPGFDGFPIEVQAPGARFEVATYQLLQFTPAIRASRLLYHRIPIQYSGSRVTIPKDIVGRRTFVFEKADGVNNVWEELGSKEQVLSILKLWSVSSLF